MGSEGVTGVERMAPGMGRLHAFPRRRIRVVVVGGQGAGTRLAARLAGFASIELSDVAFEATDALGLVDAAGPDIVVVDLGLGQALELIARLRKRLPSVHVVAHVAVASERLAEAALAAGAEVCAVESVSDAQLVEALDLLAWHLDADSGDSGEGVPPPLDRSRQAATDAGPGSLAGAQGEGVRDLREELERAHRGHEALLEALDEGVITVDFEGAVTTANASAARILGVPREDLRGRNIFDPTWVALREDGSFWPVDDRPMPRALRTGEAQRGAIYGVRRQDGSVRWVSLRHPAS